MTISGLINVIKENEFMYNARIFPFENSIIFTDKHILVRDDPNLREYFGDFLLNELTKEGSAYLFEIGGKRIKFLSKVKPPDNDAVKMYLEADVTKLELLDLTKKSEGVTQGIESYNIPNMKGKTIGVVNKLYFDYLSSIGYEEISANVLTKPSIIYFIQDKKIKSVCMPLRNEEFCDAH